MTEATRVQACLAPRQACLPGLSPIEEALQQLSQSGTEARGAVFTRREVVDFILDLVGYTPDQPLYDHPLLEPSFGNGDFLLAVVERLLDAWRSRAHRLPASDLACCIRAVELHETSFDSTRDKLVTQLCDAGIGSTDALGLAQAWLVHDDFLLADLPSSFEFVVGNPPYVRQELIPDILLAEYRARYATIFDRADIYIPFIERSLSQLSEHGKVGFICADRWMKNRYGGPLRRLVSEQFHLHTYVDMVDTPAFHAEVTAYPAIFVIGREKSDATRIAHRPEISQPVLSSLANRLTGSGVVPPSGPVKELAGVVNGAQPWLLESADQVALVRRLERDFPSIEETGCKVGIGVATGADKAFIGPFEDLDVEADRKLPLATTRDIVTGEVRWRGLGIVNPFADNGGLVELDRYPRLKRYLEARKNQIAGRHIAQKVPASWYRTIDRIYPALARQSKLLIPDIKGEAHVVYEDGSLYPHHNLYYMTSEHWDLHALQAVLLSGIARLFVATYSTRMRGGYLRFQAQYLRRIRLPYRSTVSPSTMEALVAAAQDGNVDACNRVSFELYDLSANEREVLGGIDTERQRGTVA